jgi:hypothetical protein
VTDQNTPQPAPAVRFDAHAARAWLASGAADHLGIDESFSTTNLSIVAGLEELLQALDRNGQPQVWSAIPAVSAVAILRTADGDGVDGGGLITIDVNVSGRGVRLCSRHHGYDDFTSDSATCGADAAIEALAHVAHLVNQEVALLASIADTPTGRYTVTGVWLGSQPVPVAVIAGEHDVCGGDDTAFPDGLWATSVSAPDAATAQRLAVADMLATL